MGKKTLYNILMSLGLCAVFSAQAFASDGAKPKILWDKQVVPAVATSNSREKYLQGPEDKLLEKMGEIIDKQLQATDLPFEPYQHNASLAANNTAQARANNASGGYTALIPVVLDGGIYQRAIKFSAGKFVGETRYKSDVITQLNLMFCYRDGKDFKILYNMPVAAHKSFGDDLDIAMPISKDVLRNTYVENVEAAIENALVFPKNINDLLNPEKSKTLRSYRVEEVRVTTPGIEKFFKPETLEHFVKPLVATAFTNAYAKKYPEQRVLPFNSKDINWSNLAVSHMSGSNISYKAEDEIDTPIIIDVYKIGIAAVPVPKNMQTSIERLDKYFIVGIGMKCTVDGKEKICETPINYMTSVDFPLRAKLDWNYILTTAAENLAKK